MNNAFEKRSARIDVRLLTSTAWKSLFVRPEEKPADLQAMLQYMFRVKLHPYTKTFSRTFSWNGLGMYTYHDRRLIDCYFSSSGEGGVKSRINLYSYFRKEAAATCSSFLLRHRWLQRRILSLTITIEYFFLGGVKTTTTLWRTAKDKKIYCLVFN